MCLSGFWKIVHVCFLFLISHPFVQDFVGYFGLVLPTLNDTRPALLGRGPDTMPVLVPAVASEWGSRQWAGGPTFLWGCVRTVEGP